MPTALITGAARGLGLEFTRQYAAKGYRVHACARKPETLKGIKGDIHPHQLEVTDYGAVAALARRSSSSSAMPASPAANRERWARSIPRCGAGRSRSTRWRR